MNRSETFPISSLFCNSILDTSKEIKYPEENNNSQGLK